MNLCLMLKAPREGLVKTRLAKDVGFAAAASIYRRLVEWQMSQIPAGWRVFVAYAPDDALDEMRSWLGEDPTFLPQVAGDLGDRLVAVLAQLPRPMIFLGGDCPSLTEARLLEAARALESAGVVIWPSLDGGYCLIGCSAFLPELFQGIAWSTSTVLEETLDRLPVGVDLALLEPPLEDIDDLSAWKRCELSDGVGTDSAGGLPAAAPDERGKNREP